MAENEDLKRYLQQLQEMGESELVFNSALKAPGAGTIADARDWRAALLAAGGEAAAAAKTPAKTAASAPSVIPAQRESSVVSPGPAQPQTVVPRYSLRAPTDTQAGPEAPRPAPALAAGLEVQGPPSDIFSAASAFGSLDALAASVAQCTHCVLHKSARNPVPGEGSANAELVCVGEGPGANEDETGRPFIGAAGKLLTDILNAIKLQREDVFICNVVKHRPPANRTPLPDEITACQPYLQRQLELIKPKVILALGTVAAQTLLGTKLTIGKLRGSVHRYHGIPLIVTYHPAALLRNPAWKRPTWEDVQHVRRILDGTRGA